MADGSDVIVGISGDTQQTIQDLNGLSFALKTLKNRTKGGFENVNKAASAISALNGAMSGMQGKVSAIHKLSNNLDELRNSCKKSTGTNIGSVATGIGQLRKALDGSSASLGNANGVVDAMKALKDGSQGNTGNNIAKLAGNVQQMRVAITGLTESDIMKIDELAIALSSFQGIKIPASSFNGLLKLPQVLAELRRANFDGMAEKLQKLSAAMGPFAVQVEKLAAAWKSLPAQFHSVAKAARSVTSANKTLERQESKAVTKAKQHASSLGVLSKAFNKASDAAGRFSSRLHLSSNGATSMSTILNGGMLIAGIYMVGRAFASCVTNVNEYIEAMNLAQTVMGGEVFTKMAGTLNGITYESDYDIDTKTGNGFWTKAQELMGIDSAQAIKYQAVFEDIITGMGVGRDAAAKMSQQLTQLGYDISSFNNLSIEESMQKIQSGISGELEPMRRIGYDLSVARLQQDAAAAGIEGTVSTMTQAEKVQLRYYEMMTQITEAHGDLARTLNSPANQMRILSSQVQILARNFGALLLPVLNAVLPVLTALVKLLQQLTITIASTFNVDLSKYFADLSTVDYSSMSGDLEDAADATEDGAKAAKEWKKQLMGFDEINNLTPPTDSSSSNAGAGDVGGALGLDDLGYDFFEGLAASRVNDILKSMQDALASGDWYHIGHNAAEKIAEGLCAIPWTSIQTVVRQGAKNFADMLNGIFDFTPLATGIGNAIGNAFNTLFAGTSSFVARFDFKGMGEFIGRGFQAMFDVINWKDIVATVTGGVNGVMDALNGFFDKVRSNSNGKVVSESINNMFAGINWGYIGETFANGVNEAFGFMVQFLSTLDFGAIGQSISSTITGFFQTVDWGAVGYTIGSLLWGAAEVVSEVVFNIDTWFAIIKGVIDMLLGLVASIFDNPKGFIDACLMLLAGPEKLGVEIAAKVEKFLPKLAEKIVQWSTSLGNKLNELIGKVFEFFSGIVTKAKMAFNDAMINLWSIGENAAAKIGGAFSDAWNGIQRAFGNCFSFFQGLFNDVRNLFSNLASQVGSAIRFGFLTVIYNVLATVQNAINGVLSIINAIPGVSLGYMSFADSFYYDAFANGGFPTEGQLFIAREAGPEMVGTMGGSTAVANNDQIVEGIANGVASANAAQNQLLMEQNSLLRQLLAKDTGTSISATDIAKALDTSSRIGGRPAYSF